MRGSPAAIGRVTAPNNRVATIAAVALRYKMRIGVRGELIMLDLLLAIVHHVLIFGIFGILSAELMAVRPDMSSATALRIASIDSLYGIFAAAVVIIGFCRAIFA